MGHKQCLDLLWQVLVELLFRGVLMEDVSSESTVVLLPCESLTRCIPLPVFLLVDLLDSDVQIRCQTAGSGPAAPP